ncbi:hypothetical protein JXA40_10660 [bacterium]|nr:hypothetical protein [candidate division CSSED10-310 bacterium]
MSLLFSGVSHAREYNFDMAEFEKKPYEYSAILSFNPVFSMLNQDSRLFRLKYMDSEPEDFLHEQHLSLEARGRYEFRAFKFIASGKYETAYSSDGGWVDDLSLFELNAQYTWNSNVTSWLGKKTVKWGKGYIWNPVSFVGKQKDVNDVEASLEGYSLLMGEFVKSFSSKIRTISISSVVIPVTEDLNEDFSPVKSFNFAFHAYTLVADTDLDLYLFMDDSNHHKFGADFAGNLLTNWEIHAECAYENSHDRCYLDNDYALRRSTDDVVNYLVGTRYLTPSNTTIIFEYLHNDKGYTENEMENFFEAFDSAMADQDASLLSTLKSFQKDNLTGQFLMKDYFYLKVSQPEPFDILYFTPFAYVIYNLNDGSCRMGLELNYSRFENLEIILRQNHFPAHRKTEFGEKATGYKIEFYIKWYF